MSNKPAQWWMCTVPDMDNEWKPYLPEGIDYMIGQQEVGKELSEEHPEGYRHWQLVFHTCKKSRLSAVLPLFPEGRNIQATRSKAAIDYVWKEDTRVEGSSFELGVKPFKRNSAKDYDAILSNAKVGNIDAIPSDVLLRCYSTIRKIEKDYMKPEPMQRKVIVYVGKTGVGKSKTAWENAGWDAYPKDPNTKFWDGYNGQENVVIDEFRGRIDISHVLRWFDRYPVCVENKGGGTCLKATTIYVTSNLHPLKWYPDLDAATYAALLRRIEIVPL